MLHLPVLLLAFTMSLLTSIVIGGLTDTNRSLGSHSKTCKTLGVYYNFLTGLILCQTMPSSRRILLKVGRTYNSVVHT